MKDRSKVERKPILVRAKLSEEEWEELRILAIKRNKSASDMIGSVLRDFLSRETGKDVYR